MPRSYAEQYPTYFPALRLITAITNDVNAQVTTSFDHGYLTGLIVRILVPDQQFGMTQINDLIGTIIVTDDTNFLIDIDTTLFNAFVYPADEDLSPFTAQYPAVVPIGEDNNTIYLATHNIL